VRAEWDNWRRFRKLDYALLRGFTFQSMSPISTKLSRVAAENAARNSSAGRALPPSMNLTRALDAPAAKCFGRQFAETSSVFTGKSS
jgi:hypothetical protein